MVQNILSQPRIHLEQAASMLQPVHIVSPFDGCTLVAASGMLTSHLWMAKVRFTHANKLTSMKEFL